MKSHPAASSSQAIARSPMLPAVLGRRKLLRGAKAGRNKGMALVAVLWIVAALSLMLTGMTRSVRQEVRSATAARQTVEGRATAEAAINLVLQRIAAEPVAAAGLVDVAVPFRGVNVQVRIIPMAGLIDVNRASIALLQSLLVVAGEMAPAAAQSAAEALVSWREQTAPDGQRRGFDVPEDLMLVPDFSYDRYARIADLISAGQGSVGSVNPLAAPVPVLAVLARGNLGAATRIDAARHSGGIGIDLTALDPSFIGSSNGRAYRLIATVPLPDNGSMRFTQDVNFRTGPRDALPWRILRSGRSFAPASMDSPRK